MLDLTDPYQCSTVPTFAMHLLLAQSQAFVELVPLLQWVVKWLVAAAAETVIMTVGVEVLELTAA